MVFSVAGMNDRTNARMIEKREVLVGSYGMVILTCASPMNVYMIKIIESHRYLRHMTDLEGLCSYLGYHSHIP